MAMPRIVPRSLAGFGSSHVAPVALAGLLVAGAAVAAVTVTYNTASTQSFSLKAVPVVWAAGPDSSGNAFISGFALSSNATYYTVTLKPVPEANVTWGNLTTLQNQDSVAYNVQVSGTSVSGSAKVLDFRTEFHSYGSDALVGTLDLRQASPSVELGSLAAGAKLYTRTYLKLDTGTGASDLPSAVTLTLTLS